MEQMVDDYFKPDHKASYSGASTFAKTKGLKTADLVKILSGYPIYTLHRPVRKRFPRNKTFVGGLHHTWQVDISDLSALKDHNDQYAYLLVAVDVLSKQLFVEPLKRKTAAAVVEGFKTIFKRSQVKPIFIMSDKGGEFTGAVIQRFFRENGVHFYVIHDEDTKASIAERVQRTLKSKMWRYFTHQNTRRYVNILQDLVLSYNHTPHRSIGRAPITVTRDNETDVRHHLYPPSFENIKYKFNIGDLVRIPLSRKVFRKDYDTQWTEEYFKVIRRLPRRPPVYRLEDMAGEAKLGSFHEYQL